MKHLNISLLINLFFSAQIFLLLGCGGSSTGPSTNSTSNSTDNGVVTFKLDGRDWKSGPPGHPELRFEEEAITDGKTLVRIEAFAADGSYIALSIYKDTGIGPGTYPITGPSMRGFFKEDFNEGGGFLTNGMENNPGSITITSMTEEKVVGTFSFAIRNSADPEDIKQITDGQFDVQFINY